MDGEEEGDQNFLLQPLTLGEAVKAIDGSSVIEPPPKGELWKTEKWIPLVLGIKTLLYATGFTFSEEGELIDGKTGRYPDFRTMGQPTAVNVDDCWWELLCRVGKEEGFQYRRETGETILALLDLSKLWGRDSWTPQELYLFIRAMPSAGEMENVVSYYREWFPHNADTVDTRRQSLKNLLYNWREEADKAWLWIDSKDPCSGRVDLSRVYRDKIKRKKRRERKDGEMTAERRAGFQSGAENLAL